MKVEAAKRAGAANVTHGKTKSRTFRIWIGMKSRCDHPVKHYGERGIAVCERWRSSFELFLEDMGEPPPGTQIDRIDNDGDYEPGNCRWTTPRENSINKRTTRLLTLNGTTRCITDWASELGITHQAIHQRIAILKWPVERALTERRTR